MKNYSTAVAAKIAGEEFISFIAVDLCFSATYYYTDSNVPIHYGGVRYMPAPMQLSEISYAAAMSVDRVTVSFGNADQTLSGILLTEDVRNKVIKIYFGVYDPSNYSVVGLDQVWHGIVDEWSLTEEKAEIVTVNEFILWKKKTTSFCIGHLSLVVQGHRMQLCRGRVLVRPELCALLRSGKHGEFRGVPLRPGHGGKGNLVGQGVEMKLFAKKMRRFIDKPFKKGGTGRGGYDCLGLVASVQEALGKPFPREFAGWSEKDYWKLYEKDRTEAEDMMIRFFDSFAAPVAVTKMMPGDIVVIQSKKNNWRFPAVYCGNGNCITALADLGTRVFRLTDALPIIGVWRVE